MSLRVDPVDERGACRLLAERSEDVFDSSFSFSAPVLSGARSQVQLTMSDDLSIASLFDVKGKVAVVTGGGSGIGSMIAAAYVQNGAKVYIAARKEKQLKDVCDMLNAKGPGSCHYFVADLMTKAGCDKLAASVMERESKVHILVNNSGMTWGARYDE
ncbi:uncharacterized protein B0H18DRAFT_86472 [Fomitopsis serialis]|uniref:uncharacterized protein n=1 Tax=Fomitopsis serialis TaxID=139415 RepID=UPI002008D312|nr:uncharacterized protein B0H18DRAFT_86472 [Neoantrodia serialis]KAH9931513.1 hypothetical protein B0H18DRAFT_86472 [Neoantrodia serialis]